MTVASNRRLNRNGDKTHRFRSHVVVRKYSDVSYLLPWHLTIFDIDSMDDQNRYGAVITCLMHNNAYVL